MLGNFTYCNPTKLYFGQNALDGLNEELPKYGKNILLVYGGGSIKKNGIYDKVVEILRQRNERRLCDYQSPTKTQNRTRIRRKCISKILNTES